MVNTSYDNSPDSLDDAATSCDDCVWCVIWCVMIIWCVMMMLILSVMILWWWSSGGKPACLSPLQIFLWYSSCCRGKIKRNIVIKHTQHDHRERILLHSSLACHVKEHKNLNDHNDDDDDRHHHAEHRVLPLRQRWQLHRGTCSAQTTPGCKLHSYILLISTMLIIVMTENFHDS